MRFTPLSETSWNDSEGHAVAAELRARGFTELSTTVPEHGKWRWAVRHGWVDEVSNGSSDALAGLDREHFSYEVMRDALVAPNQHLADDAVVERWVMHLAQAVRDARADLTRLDARLSTHPDLRTAAMGSRLRGVRWELESLTSRQQFARRCVTDFDARLRRHVSELTEEARWTCATQVRRRLILDGVESGDDDDRLVVATDASGRGGEACGYGWIAEDGRLGYGLTITTEPHQAEMIAICRAAAAPQIADRRLLILPDNKGCVDLISRVLQHGLEEIQRRSRHPLPWIGQAYAQRHRITVNWVRGHRGHILNEAADRLAALAIREGAGETPEIIADEIADIRRRFAGPDTNAATLRAA